MKIAAIALNTWRESMRDRVLVATMLILAVVIGLTLIMEGPGPGRTQAVLDLGLTLMSGAGTLVAIFLGTSLVHKELDKRTVYVVLTKPVSRYQFLMGKFLGLMGTLTLMVAVMGLGLFALIALVGGGSATLFAVLAALWMQLGLVTAMAFCFSTITNGTLAAIYTMGFFLLGQQTLLIRQFADSEAKLNLFNYYVGRALYHVLPNFGVFDYKNAVIYGGHLPWNAWGYGMAYGACMCLALMVLASLAWEGRELT